MPLYRVWVRNNDTGEVRQTDPIPARWPDVARQEAVVQIAWKQWGWGACSSGRDDVEEVAEEAEA